MLLKSTVSSVSLKNGEKVEIFFPESAQQKENRIPRAWLFSGQILQITAHKYLFVVSFFVLSVSFTLGCSFDMLIATATSVVLVPEAKSIERTATLKCREEKKRTGREWKVPKTELWMYNMFRICVHWSWCRHAIFLCMWNNIEKFVIFFFVFFSLFLVQLLPTITKNCANRMK